MEHVIPISFYSAHILSSVVLDLVLAHVEFGLSPFMALELGSAYLLALIGI
jgi:predicted transcriptional regulator